MPRRSPPPLRRRFESPFHRGVNVLGYDPYWTDASKRRFEWRHFAEIRRAGFDHVRINLQAFRHMDSANRLEPQWLAKLDDAVREAQKAGLGVILDEHDFNKCSDDVPACRAQLTAFWSQVAPRFAGAPRNVAFELLNEPHDKLNGEPWNALLADALAVVRRTNPNRIVVVGPTHWNSLKDLPLLKLPADPNLLLTFHYYEPFHFTHQGATWAGEEVKGLHGISWGTRRTARPSLRTSIRSPPGPRPTGGRSCSVSSGPTTRAGRRSNCAPLTPAQSGARPSGAASAGPIGSSRATSSSGT